MILMTGNLTSVWYIILGVCFIWGRKRFTKLLIYYFHKPSYKQGQPKTWWQKYNDWTWKEFPPVWEFLSLIMGIVLTVVGVLTLLGI